MCSMKVRFIFHMASFQHVGIQGDIDDPIVESGFVFGELVGMFQKDGMEEEGCHVGATKYTARGF